MRLVLRYLKAQGHLPRGRLKRVPRVDHTRQVEKKYAALLLAEVTRMREKVRTHVLPRIPNIVAEGGHVIRRDAVDYTIDQTIGDVRLVYETLPASTFSATASAVNEAEKKTHTTQFHSVLGVIPQASEPWLVPMMRGWAKTNARLVKNTTDLFVDRLGDRILAGVQAGLRAETLAAQISADFVATDGLEVTNASNRARLIARDQVASFRGDLDRSRQTEIGVSRFVWRTSEDERVRPSHRERDGMTFSWDAPIEIQLEEKNLTVDKIEGYPGRPINCRCTAEPVLDDLLDGIEDDGE